MNRFGTQNRSSGRIPLFSGENQLILPCIAIGKKPVRYPSRSVDTGIITSLRACGGRRSAAGFQQGLGAVLSLMATQSSSVHTFSVLIAQCSMFAGPYPRRLVARAFALGPGRRRSSLLTCMLFL